MKHALGLANERPANGALVYLYYDWPVREAATHRAELDRVVARLVPEIDLRALTYQALFGALRAVPGLDARLSRLSRAALLRLTRAACVRERPSLSMAATRPQAATTPSGRALVSPLRHCAGRHRGSGGRRARGVRRRRRQASSAAASRVDGTLEQAYRACLWSRVANRVLLEVAEFPAPTPEALYDGVRTVDWSAHLAVDGTLAVDCTSTRSAITHTQFAALKIKDAIVDQFRERTGVRPSVDVAAPDVRVNLHLDRDVATRRDRSRGRAACIGAAIAARRAPRRSRRISPRRCCCAPAGRSSSPRGDGELGFVDPMCGSGSLAIEAALIAADVAPGCCATTSVSCAGAATTKRSGSAC